VSTIGRWGVVVKPSNDKGPFKLIRVKSEMREFTAMIHDPYGLAGNPAAGTLVKLSSMGDGGMESAAPVDLSKKRFDGLKGGEALVGNTETGTHTKMTESGDREDVIKGSNNVAVDKKIKVKAGGNIETTSDGDVLIKSGGIVHINPPD